jgi:hypothetical protein
MSDQNPSRAKRPRSDPAPDDNPPRDTTTAHEKVAQVATLLHEWHWGFGTLVKHWLTYKDGRYKGLRGVNKKVELLRVLLVEDPEDTYKDLKTHDLLVESMEMATTFLVNGIRDELSALQDESTIFGRWNADVDFKDLNLSMAGDELRTHAPILTHLLTELAQNKRGINGSYNRVEDTGYIVMVASILLLKSSQKTANGFARMLGLYLQGSGLKRRVIAVLHGLGIIESYWALDHSKKALSQRSEVSIISS